MHACSRLLCSKLKVNVAGVMIANEENSSETGIGWWSYRVAAAACVRARQRAQCTARVDSKKKDTG